MVSRHIEDLHPYLKFLYYKFAGKMGESAIPFMITCTYRSQDEQNDLYEQGRTKPGKIVTWTTRSKHSNTLPEGTPASLAFDIAILKDGKPIWDLKADVNNDNKADYRQAAEIGREVGLKPGADFNDMCHFEYQEAELTIPPKVEVPTKVETIEDMGLWEKIKLIFKGKKLIEEGTKVKPGVKTSELWVAVAAALVVFMNKFLGWGLNEQDVITFLTPIMGYLLSRTATKLKG